MQKNFENGECTHRKEKIPVGAVFGFVLLTLPPMSFPGHVLMILTHRVIGQFHND